MWLRARSKTALCLSVASFLFTPAIAKHQETTAVRLPAHRVAVEPLTCDRNVIDPISYEMATVGQAQTLLSDRSDFWDAFLVNKHVSTLDDLNGDMQELAERALERDPRNMMAASMLARQYAILGSEREAVDAWTRIADNGGVVVWTATLYDVDYKSYFLMSFGRDAVRIYRMGQFTGSIDRHLGYAKFPEPGEVAFYEAAAGCPSLSVTPVTTIPWSQVKELRSGNWVLWFKLAKPATVTSDRGIRKTLGEIKVNLHGETGVVKFLAERNPDFDPEWDDETDAVRNLRGIALGPWDYNRRLRDLILRFAEPAAHIKRTSAGKGAGW
jgi:hypothetical protein